MKLNDRQREVVTENHNLIYGYAHENGLDLEEWYGLLSIELCKAVLRYDSSKAELSTLYYNMCNNLLKSSYRDGNVKKRQDGGLLSLDYKYTSVDSTTFTMVDRIVEENIESVGGTVINSMTLEGMLEGQFGEVIQLRHDGYTQNEISKKLGWSQSYISTILRDARRRHIDGEDDY